MNTSYHNTTNLPHNVAADAVRLARKQDAAVLAIFQRSPHQLLSPSEVCAAGITSGRRWLITSVRRSISNLTEVGALVRTGRMVDGPHGRPEHLWQLAGPKPN